MIIVNAVLAGAIAMASLIASLFFLRFWRSTNDRFFLYFALSFLFEAVDRALLGLASSQSEDAPEYYLLRLVAYALIVYAVLDKNRRKSRHQ